MPQVQGLGRAGGLVMDASGQASPKGNAVANDEEPLLADPPTHEAAMHVQDYERFTKMMKRGAILCFFVGLFSLFFIASYW